MVHSLNLSTVLCFRYFFSKFYLDFHMQAVLTTILFANVSPRGWTFVYFLNLVQLI